MAVQPLRTAFTGLDILTTPAKPFNFQEHPKDEIVKLCQDIVESLYKYEGLGISANQLEWKWQEYAIFAMRGVDENRMVIFNPRIARPGDENIKMDEACLSFPGLVVPITRPKVVRVRCSGADGNFGSQNYTGMTARIFQHEVDHLNGKMWFEGCNRLHLERAIRKAKNKGKDYSAMGLMKYAS